MGRFINGQHHSWTSELGPNERFGAEDDMSFQTLALKLQNKKDKNHAEQNDNKIVEQTIETQNIKDTNREIILNNLFTELKTYQESRENAITLIKEICETYSEINYCNHKELSELITESIAVEKLLEYYVKKFKK